MGSLRYLAATAFLLGARAGSSLSDEELKLLQDPGGWEYVSMSDDQDGFPTVHTCFDGTPHPDQCSGTLTFSEDKNFTQVVRIHGQNVRRTGRYELSDNQLAFFDEFGTRDGPYTLTLDSSAKSLKLAMPQVTVELLLEKEYRERLRKSKKNRGQ